MLFRKPATLVLYYKCPWSLTLLEADIKVNCQYRLRSTNKNRCVVLCVQENEPYLGRRHPNRFSPSSTFLHTPGCYIQVSGKRNALRRIWYSQRRQTCSVCPCYLRHVLRYVQWPWWLTEITEITPGPEYTTRPGWPTDRDTIVHLYTGVVLCIRLDTVFSKRQGRYVTVCNHIQKHMVLWFLCNRISPHQIHL